MSVRTAKRRSLLAALVYLGTCYLVPAGALSVCVIASLCGSGLEGLQELMSLTDWRGGLAMGVLAIAVVITTFAGLSPLLYHIRSRRRGLRQVVVLSVVHAVAALVVVTLVTASLLILAFVSGSPVLVLTALPMCWAATILSGEIVRSVSDRILRRR